MSLQTRLLALCQSVAGQLRTRITANHPGVAKAWVCFGISNAQVQVRRSFQVQSVTRMARGRYRLNFVPALPTADYGWHAQVRDGLDRYGYPQMLQVTARTTQDSKTAQVLDIACVAIDGSLQDATEINVVIHH
ncbi:hypothetical protein [Ottowia testudinis]|uniref:Uncharacterized protein n=1 Tax=Ottowia testudinis TaxID=2816950 RepID=A0A975CH49_9BURK|nr:hypothetical protein [Ottowia testudinis]QTD44981.1 hypothetical protein J1M35_18350 [Ottowia testudinis]